MEDYGADLPNLVGLGLAAIERKVDQFQFRGVRMDEGWSGRHRPRVNAGACVCMQALQRDYYLRNLAKADARAAKETAKLRIPSSPLGSAYLPLAPSLEFDVKKHAAS